MLAALLKKCPGNRYYRSLEAGEEFLIILPDTEEKGAMILAEKIRTIVENTDFKVVGKLTASFGVSAYLPQRFVTGDVYL